MVEPVDVGHGGELDVVGATPGALLAFDARFGRALIRGADGSRMSARWRRFGWQAEPEPEVSKCAESHAIHPLTHCAA